MNYIFKRAEIEDVPKLFEIIKTRVQWMEAKGLKQWNTTDYLNVYPLSYFEDHQKNGRLFCMKDVESGDVAAVMVLLSDDRRWAELNTNDAYYVHNFATNPKTKGIGSIMLSEAEKLALSEGKTYLRLDCPADNQVLNRFYESRGYSPCGSCVDGPYRGNRKEKKL